MLTQNQEGYLKTVPEGKIAHVVAFDPGAQIVAGEIIREIEVILPTVKIIYLGSSKLGIAGENDIDMTVLSGDDFNGCFRSLESLYGKPTRISLEKKYIKWEFVRNGFPVELHLNDIITPNFQEQIDTQRILENDPVLRSEYEHIKLASDGLPWKEYLKRKYEFWNRILGMK
jgi:hypothetical protein